MRGILFLTLVAAAACGPAQDPPRTVRPGAPGEPTRQVEPARAGVEAGAYTPADVAFLQGMIPHHAQALVMADLVPDRTASGEMRLLAERIVASQRSEIAQMRRWLTARGEAPPAPAEGEDHARHAGHAGAAEGAGRMHGMAAPWELARLESSRAGAFDRLFLELMIRHHEGALTMTRELLASPGAGREPELFQLISHIDADQRAEIARMRRMLDSLQ